MTLVGSDGGRGAEDQPLVVVMGVSGSGKSTVGEALARRLGVPFAEGDDFHDADNLAKMSTGVPLDDADRWPWLAAIGAWLANHVETGGVVTCSALRRQYRDVLRQRAPAAFFAQLDGEADVIRRRMRQRRGHFMPPDLLRSQLQALQPLGPDEAGVVADLAQPVDQIVEQVTGALAGLRQGRA